ncbi:MAG: sigma 54-interacting transcriptional regulator [Candidatus Hydrogenedentes bacterium]|nr:sigma 54-interacting transcriptional regulator [Candidatus Hydrogenedentota bacterium]
MIALTSESLHKIALSAANERSLDEVLQNTVKGLSEEPYVALARIWMLRPGDRCSECKMAESCTDHARCLHLVASAGASMTDPAERWENVLGGFQRLPLNLGRIGQIANEGIEILVKNVCKEGSWVIDPEWAAREKIVSFAAHPLRFRDEMLGVLALFSRQPLCDKAMLMLKAFADNAAAAIANARAFEEIENLRHRLELENHYLRSEMQQTRFPCGMIGETPGINKIKEQIQLVAPTGSTVLIEGESGTGKEMIACAIHSLSTRTEGPMVRVNCASIPRDLFESEFFGHVKGAFTGAVADRVGRFQLAHGGTIFLDEVGEIPLELQSKLLRVLQNGEYERIGEATTRKADVRIVAATNRDLREAVSRKEFREDLYFRLSVFPIRTIPLRERVEDIPLLAQAFIARTCKNYGKEVPALKLKHVLELQQYSWPGNVRELENIIERAIIISPPGAIILDVPADYPQAAVVERHEHGLRSNALARPSRLLTYDDLREIERRNIEAALKQTHGKIAGHGGAAELLGIKPTTLASRIKAMGIAKPVLQ